MNPFVQKNTSCPYVSDYEATLPLSPDADGPRELKIALVRARDGACRAYLYYGTAAIPAQEVACSNMPNNLFCTLTGAPERLVESVVKAQAVPLARALERLMDCVDGMDDATFFDEDFILAVHVARKVLADAKKQA
jgi:hypothetical protein